MIELKETLTRNTPRVLLHSMVSTFGSNRESSYS